MQIVIIKCDQETASFKGEGWDGGKILANLHDSNDLTPFLTFPLQK